MPGCSGWEVEQAVKRNDKKFIELEFRKHNLDLSVNFLGRTPLTACVVENQAEALQLLLKLGADPDGKSYEGGRREPPLITAVRLKNLPCVKILASSGANLTLTNFYGQDAVYQAVVENAYEILEYLLTKLPSKTYDHEPRMACPIHLALHNSLNHPLKRKSLGLLLGFHYNCFCLAEIVRQMRKSSVSLPFSSSSSQARPNHSSSSNIRPQEEHLIIVKVDPQIYHWISAYDAHQQEYHWHHHHQRQHHPLLKLEPSQENYYNYYKPHAPPIRLEVIERNDEKLPLTPQLLSHDKIKLCDLTRKLVRRTCSQYAWEKKISFHQAATSLRLPWKLINFLFLSQLLRNGGGGSSKCGGKQQSSS